LHDVLIFFDKYRQRFGRFGRFGRFLMFERFGSKGSMSSKGWSEGLNRFAGLSV